MDLIKKKIIALLHDPFHKPYVVANVTGRIYAPDKEGKRAHEAEAEEIAKILGINFFNEYIREVEEADRFAASLDRVVIPDIKVSRKGTLSLKFVNPFDPSFSTEIVYQAGHRKEIKEFYEELKKLLKEKYIERCNKGNVDDCRKVYHILYALTEPIWYEKVHVPPVADTRIPTHTVFDHLSATASVLNMLSKGHVDGWLVEVDIPGVQKFIEGARNPGDAWAKSWFLSAMAWKLVEDLVWELGADILILPTARYNPFYYSLLREKFKGDKEVLNVLNDGTRGLPKADQPVMPATVTLILPKSRFNTEESIKRYFNQRLREIWKELIRQFKESIEKNSEIRRMIDEGLKNYSMDFDEFEKLLEKSVPIRVSVTVLNIGKAFKEFEEGDWKKIEEEVVNLLKNVNFKEINPYWNDINDALRDMERKLFYHWLFTKKFVEIKKEKKKIKVDTKVYDTWSFKVLENVYNQYTSDNARRKVEDVLKFCSCGRPAVVHNNSDRVIEGIKPKEALCPQCLLLRRLQYEPGIRKVLVHDYVEPPKISISTLAVLHELACELSQRGYGRLYELIQGLRQVVPIANVKGILLEYEDVLHRLQEEEKINAYLPTPGESEPIPISLGRDDLKWLKRLNRYYAVVRADGDGMGELLSGKLKTSWDEVRGYWLKLTNGNTVATNFAVNILRLLCKLYKKQLNVEKRGKDICLSEVDECKEEGTFKFTTLVTPTYHAQISYSQMITAMLDAKIINTLGGVLAFAGGDDILALLPARSYLDKISNQCHEELKVLIEGELKKDGLKVAITYFYSPALWAWWLTRLNYWGLLNRAKGFHWLRMAFAPAPVAFGRKYGIVFRHYRTPLALAFSEASELEEKAKGVGLLKPFKLPKDGVSMHYGPSLRKDEAPVLPNGLFACSKKELCLGYVLAKLSALFYIYPKVSKNVYEDVLRSVENYSNLKDGKLCRAIVLLIKHVISRNVSDNREEKRRILDNLLVVYDENEDLCKHLRGRYSDLCDYLENYSRKEEDSLAKLLETINMIYTLSKVVR